jgi:hypothetical protein
MQSAEKRPKCRWRGWQTWTRHLLDTYVQKKCAARGDVTPRSYPSPSHSHSTVKAHVLKHMGLETTEGKVERCMVFAFGHSDGKVVRTGIATAIQHHMNVSE